MTLYQFNALDEMEQIEAIWDKGIKIGERKDEIYSYNLYKIDSFYVEEKFRTEHNVRIAFKSFSSTDSKLLEPYLEMIDISKLA